MPSGITPRQQLLVDALAVGLTVTKAAERVGIARKTAYNWLEGDAFRAALATRRKELAERVADRVAELGQTCLTAVMDYIAGAGEDEGSYGKPARVKLAAKLIRDMGLLGGPSPGRRAPPAMGVGSAEDS
jgi:hypothetical protein